MESQIYQGSARVISMFVEAIFFPIALSGLEEIGDRTIGRLYKPLEKAQNANMNCCTTAGNFVKNATWRVNIKKALE